MPVIQLDWVKLIARFADVTGLYFLTHRQASLLLSLTEQLTWEKTYRAFDYDFDDWDTVQLEVADLQRYLTMPVNLVDLIGYIDEIEELLLALQVTANCCDGNSDISDGDLFTDVVVDGVGDVPQNIIDAGYAEDVDDWDGFDDYKCMISHVIVDSMEAKLRKLAPFVDSAGVIIGGIATLTSIVTVIFSGGLSVLALGLIAATGSTALLYKLLTSGSFLIGIADDVSDDHDELACAVYNGDGSAGSLASLDDKIDELYDVPVTTILQNLNLGPELKALYAGRYKEQDIAQALVDAGYELIDFDCDCPIEYDFSPTWDFEVEGDHPETPWQTNGPWHTPCGGSLRALNVNQDFILAVDDLREHVGLAAAGTITLHKITWVWMRSTTSLPVHTITINFTGGPWAETNDNTPFECVEEEHTFDPPVVVPSGTQDFIEFTNADAGNHMYLGFCQLDFDAA